MSVNKKHIKIITFGNFPFGGSTANLLRNFALSLSNLYHIEVILPIGSCFGNNIDANSHRVGQLNNVFYRHVCFLKHPTSFVGKLIDNICGLVLPFFYILKQSILKKMDVIILYDTSFTNLIVYNLCKVFLRKKLIVFIPDYYEKPSLSIKTLIPLLNWYNFYLGLHLLVKFADGYIVVSHFLKTYLSIQLKIDKPILILPSVINPLDFEVKDALPYKKNYITIGYTGTPTYKDGVVDLIKSFAVLCQKHPHLHLLIIGDVVGGQSVIPPLQTLAADLGVSDQVSFTGLVSFKNIPALIGSCQILALTRPAGIFAEAGFPTKLGEYFVVRKPVVITQVGDIPLYFTPDKHLIMVQPNDINSIVNGFEKLINNHEITEVVTEEAYKWASENLFYYNVSSKIDHFLIKTCFKS